MVQSTILVLAQWLARNLCCNPIDWEDHGKMDAGDREPGETQRGHDPIADCPKDPGWWVGGGRSNRRASNRPHSLEVALGIQDQLRPNLHRLAKGAFALFVVQGCYVLHNNVPLQAWP
jgi:hypothetical protein